MEGDPGAGGVEGILCPLARVEVGAPAAAATTPGLTLALFIKLFGVIVSMLLTLPGVWSPPADGGVVTVASPFTY